MPYNTVVNGTSSKSEIADNLKSHFVKVEGSDANNMIEA